ncbi:hypothetical protein ACRTDU_02690 [Sunxiuqinia elliptica]
MISKVTWIKYLMSFILLFGAMGWASAQENPKYVCDVNANTAIDLGLDVVGDVLTREGGYWDQVDPNDNNLVLAHDVSNIFVLTGLAPGTYQFVYTATNNVCLPQGQTKTGTIVILQTPKDFSHVVYSCTGETPALDLSGIIPAGLPTSVTYTVTMPATGVTLNADGKTLELGDYTGTVKVGYMVDYTGEGAPADVCNNEATITVEVIRDNDSPELTVESILYCKETTPLSVNLSNLGGMTAYENAGWALASSSVASDVTVTGNVATFTGTEPPVAGVYTFTYSWEGTSCYGAGSSDLVVTIVEDGLTLPANPTDEICKSDDPNRIYDLTLEGLGLALPSSTGKWVKMSDSEPENQNIEIDITDGLFDLELVRAGTYKYKYIVSDVADVCGLTGETILTLTVGDVGGGSMEDGRLQLCAADLESKTGNLKLSDFLLSVPAEATWTGPNGTTMIGDNLDEVAYSELDALGVGTYKFSFNYGSVGCSGTGEGFLVVSITNNMSIADEVTLNFCRPDMPDAISLFQVIGADLKGTGTWAKETSTPDDSFTITEDGVFTETAAEVLPGPKTYVMKYTASSSTPSNCDVPATITVTIKVDDDSF